MDGKPKKNVRDWAAWLLCIAFALVLAWLFFRYIFGLLLPFLVGWALAFLVRPAAARVGRGTCIPNRVLRLMFVLAAFLALGAGVVLLGVRGVRELQRLLAALTSGGGALPPTLETLTARLRALGGDRAVAYLQEFISGAIRALTGVLPGLVGRLISGVPRIVLALAVTLISAVYFCLDLERINAAMLSLLPDSWKKRVTSLKNGILRMAGKYLRSYLILMAITFSLLLLGFLVIRVEYAVLLAFLISLVDLFPVLGVGTVLVPWSLFCFISGVPGRGVALLILWGVALIIRQLTEPRVLGGSLGVPPLLTLLAMYAGLHLMGVFGMLLLPALCVPLASLLRTLKGAPPPAPESETAQHRAPPSSADGAKRHV